MYGDVQSLKQHKWAPYPAEVSVNDEHGAHYHGESATAERFILVTLYFFSA